MLQVTCCKLHVAKNIVFFSLISLIVSIDLARAAEDPKKAPPKQEIKATAASVAKKDDKSSFEAEKAKALQNPYANDFGPATLDVSGYPADKQAGYKVLQAKCSKCHTPSRPLNSQFIEPSGKDLAEREKKVADLKKSNPEMFKDKNVFQVEPDIWQRYVKRMMAKPGCEITKDEGKKVWDFLVYDSNQRKLGANKEAWAKHRRALLDDFKQKNPARYKELYESAATK